MIEPTLELKKTILREKIILWQNTYYSSQLDATVGKDIDDPSMVSQAKAQMKRCLRAVQILEEVLTELEQGEE